MKMSKSTELAIHGLYQLAVSKPKQLLVAEMAGAQKVSTSYLAKVFQRLARKGLVRSTRGKRGGFSLACEPCEISLADVVKAVEADEPLYSCMGEVRGCEAMDDCLVRHAFEEASQKMYAVLNAVSVEDLLKSNGTSKRAWMITT